MGDNFQATTEDFEKAQLKLRQEITTKFEKAFKKMIATSEEAYRTNNSVVGRTKAMQHYNSEEIRRIVNCGTIIEQANLSEFFFATNGLYKRIILHYATFLTYSWLLVPFVKGHGKNKITNSQVSKSYYDAVDFCSSFQIERKCTLFARDVFVKGAYYGIVIEDGKDIVILDLPFDYCRSRYKNHQDIDVIEFNLEFFKKITDEDTRDLILSSYPKIIQKAWRKYFYSNGPKWIFIPPEMGIYFCFFDERPFFLDLIPLLDDLDDYKVLDKQRNVQALKRILVQEVPHDGMKLVFEPQEAEMMHNGAINMLSKNQDTDVITSYAKVSLLDMSSKDDEKTTLSSIQDLIYSSAGLSKELFFATTEAGIEYSIDNDLALVMILGQRFAHFFTVLLNSKYENKKIKFKFLILPISYYKAEDYADRARELASFGYIFIPPILSIGLDQASLTPMKDLENELLDLDIKLKPLQSSYTQSGKKAGEPIGDVQNTEGTSTEVNTDEKQDSTN